MPICSALGAGQLNDAEDVAVQTFEVLWESRLLVRWISNHTARLRSLLCSVTRKILANRHRVRAGRDRLARDVAELCAARGNGRSAGRGLLCGLGRGSAAASGRIDCGQVLSGGQGRLCARALRSALPATEHRRGGRTLDIQPSAVDNYFRHARQRLAYALQSLLRQQIDCYTSPEEAEQEFQTEWQ